MRRTLALAAVLACAAPVSAIKVCFLDDDLPRAHRATATGFDFEVMGELAAVLDQALEPVWVPSRPAFSEIDSSDLPLARVAAGECLAVASVPGAAALGRYRGELVLSDPYYGAAFEVVGPAGVARTLRDLRGKTVAVQLQSIAHAVLGSLGIDWRVRSSVAELLELVDGGEADAAVVWGPALAPHGRQPVAGYEAPQGLRWNEHVALRADVPLEGWINETLRQLQESGRLQALAEKYGIPYHPPFPSTSDPAAVRSLRSGR